MKKAPGAFRLLSFLFLIILLASCQQEKEIPFPENASGFKKPVAKPFTLPEAKPFEWKSIDPFILPKGVTVPLDFNKIPYQNFSINDFKPLKAPLTSLPLNWDNLKEIKINLDSLEGQPFSKKLIVLPEPIITRAIPPSKWEGSTAGILRLGQSEGMLGNSIYAITADAFGAIWIATEKGLTKYVGDEFKTYNFFERSTEGNLETVLDLASDHEGNLLITGFESGLYKLNIRTGIITHFKIGKGFARIEKDHTGTIWLSSFENGLYFIKPGQDSIYKLHIPFNNINNNLTIGTFEDSKKNMWFGFVEHIVILNPERNTLKIIAGDDELEFAAPYEFTEDAKGSVWLSSLAKESKSISIAEDKIYVLNHTQGFFGGAKGIIEDPLKRIWIMDNDTVTIFDPSQNTIKKIRTGANYRRSGWPATSFMDDNEMIWIGSQNIGALIIDPLGPLSEHFDKSTGLASNDVWGLVEDQQERVWMATYAGLNVYDQKNDRLYYLKYLERSGPNDYRNISHLSDGRVFAAGFGVISIIDLKKNLVTVYPMADEISNVFWKAVEDKEGNIWIPSANGIIKFNPQKNTWLQANVASGLPSNTVWFLFPDTEGNYWTFSDTGIGVIDPIKNTVAFVNKKDGLPSNYVSAAFLSNKGEVIVGGDKGFSIINKSKTEITNVTSEEGLSPQSMYDLIEYNGKIRVGSENGLIIIERPDTNGDSLWRFYNYGKQEGFPYNDYNQSASLYTKSKTAWHGASPILSVLLQEPIPRNVEPKIHITNVNVMDQHPAFQNIHYQSKFLTTEDTLWNGPKFYTTSTLSKDTSYIATSKIKWDSLEADTDMPIGLKLPHTENSLSFTFSNRDIKGRDKIVYRYLLAGADTKWSEIDSKPFSKNYYNLVSGSYTFKVATRGFNGIWSEPATFSFTVLPPWWQTWWAYALFFILFGAIVTIIVQVRSQWLKRENRILEERVAHRTEQLKKSIDDLKTTQSQLIQSEKMASLGELTAGIAHEIQNPLNFVNNFADVNKELIEELQEELAAGKTVEALSLTKDIKDNEEKIMFHGKRADSIVKGMLQHSRSSNGTKEPTDINVLADEYLRLAYHGLRAKDKSFNATMNTNFDSSLEKVSVIPQDLGRVILNLITNAFYVVAEKSSYAKASEDKQYEPTVTVTTKNLPNQIEITVADNGNGIPQNIIDKIFQPFFTTKPSGQGTGLGLSMSYEIITKSHGGDLKVETRDGEGTTFKIVLPK